MCGREVGRPRGREPSMVKGQKTEARKLFPSRETSRAGYAVTVKVALRKRETDGTGVEDSALGQRW